MYVDSHAIRVRLSIMSEQFQFPDGRLTSVGRLNRAEYTRMFIEQNGLCAICGKPERRLSRTGGPYLLAVDHDHATGKVRALLCNDCNACLGLLGESVPTLRAMVAYLEKHKVSG
jgi:Recombination endonuclease VII